MAATQKLVKELVEENMVVFQPVKKSIVKPELVQEEESLPRASATSLPAKRDGASLLPPCQLSAKEFPARLTPRRWRMFC